MVKIIDLMDTLIEDLLHLSIQHFYRYSKDNNLSLPQFGTMLRIHRLPSCGVSELGDEMGISNAAASQMLERLVQQGYVVRSEDPIDRRVKKITLSENGKKIVLDAIKSRNQHLEEIIESLSEQEQNQMKMVFSLLIDKLDAIK